MTLFGPFNFVLSRINFLEKDKQACFYKGNHIQDVKKMVDFGQMRGGKREDNGQTHGGSSAAHGIRVLCDASLI
ncbi:hypothetical protein DVH24_034650 [Malus domestica]|uniref:Uncharacterized protein n=1 Tax=Malus domestica TaxID=3750 RepID=A0A498IX22_MALDO|nr:hypothetical protein DVH24_034650 [Malus domestica]